MTTPAYEELDERAFAIFVRQGLEYSMNSDPSLDHGWVVQYLNRLWNLWLQMTTEEKTPYHSLAREELRRVLAENRTDLFRAAIRDTSRQQG